MRVLVTGANGQVGRAIAELAGSAAQLDFTLADRGAADLAQTGSAARLVDEIRPDAVVNAAAYTAVDKAESEPELAFAVNATGAAEVAEAAARLDVPIIQLSTDYVFDGRAKKPYDESAAINPLNAYGRSKLAAERAVAAANPRHVILRTSWVHSPFGTNFVKTMLRLAQDRDEVRVVDDQIGCPTSAASLAVAIVEVLSRWQSGDSSGQGEIYHLAGDGSCSWAAFASGIFELSRSAGGPSATIVPISTGTYPTPAKRPLYTVFDCTKFESDFGIRLPPWPDALVPVVERLVHAQ